MVQSNEPTIAGDVPGESGIRLDAILETAVDAIITIDARGRIELFNRAAEEMFGYRADEVAGRNVSILMPEAQAARHDDYIRDFKHSGTPRVIGRRREITALRRDGSEFPIELALSSVVLNDRRIFTGMIRDISRRRAAEHELTRYREHLEHMVAERTAALEQTKDELRAANARLEILARVDELTRVGNRRSFDERLALEWRRQQRNASLLSVVIFDVDHFKAYNDRYGHPAGDECLVQVADTLRGCFQRASDFVSRYGGEEFAIIVANTPEQAVRERADVARAAVESCAIAHGASGASDYVTVSAGVATAVPDNSINCDALVATADQALYRAKENGRNRLESATPGVQAVAAT